MTGNTQPPGRTVLVTGASGYVGGRLVAALVERGLAVRCMARRPELLRPRVPAGVEVVEGDVLRPDGLGAALEGVHTAYYLVHSMGAAQPFDAADRDGAEHFGRAARLAGVQRIIYLGGLGRADSGLSPHLRSRQEVGAVLRESGVQVVEFRASVVLGSGSLSFELIRALTERLPVMVTPRWVDMEAQPIHIDDVLAYLVEARDMPLEGQPIFEIGGAERVSYRRMMELYARQRGLRRVMIRVPLLTPRLSSLWLGLVTPLYARVGRKLIDSIRNPTVVSDTAALRTFAVRPCGAAEAIARALRNEDRAHAATRWCDALAAGAGNPGWAGVRFGNRLADARAVTVPVAPAVAFAVIRRIGGPTGWYFANPLWRLRGWLDLLVGGVGLRRGRGDPEALQAGDVLDLWRVEAVEPGRRLRLAAEMKLPGRAWLEFEVRPAPEGASIHQTAVFDPVGLAGLVYWYGIYPLHWLVFAGMLRGIAAAAMAEARPHGAGPAR